MASPADAPRSPGRPRSVRADEAIVEATLDLLAEGSTVETISIEAIAGRAGVGKATIYRRWPNKTAVLHDALRTLKGTLPQLANQSVRDDLVVLVGAVGQHIDPRAARIMPSLVPTVSRSPDRYELYQSIIEPRRALMREVLQRGMRGGELRADVDIELIMALLAGPMLVQRMLRWHPGLDEATMPEQIVDTVLAGLRPAG